MVGVLIEWMRLVILDFYKRNYVYESCVQMSICLNGSSHNP